MTLNRRPRPSPDNRQLRLWGVGRVLSATVVAAALAASSVFYGLAYLLGFEEIDTTAKLDAKTLFDLVKISFGVVAGAGALVALVVAYRRQRVDEAGAHREATRLHTERFSQAVDKLGSDSPAVRLGGVHALAGLADDAPDASLRQTCVDVLCAYLQLPFTPDPGDDPGHREEHHRFLALRKVRHTILRLIGDHYRRPNGAHRSWQGCDLDLTGVIIDCDMDFSQAVFSGRVSFRDAAFFGGEVSFDGAVFAGGSVIFAGALFAGSNVVFADALFSDGKVIFDGAEFHNGLVTFNHAMFTGGRVSFVAAMFSGGRVTFVDAAFAGGEVSFASSLFSGGEVSFQGAMFSGGEVFFLGVAFSGSTVNFRHTAFSGSRVMFNDAAFSADEVTFQRARFLGGEVSFNDATGPAPFRLLAAVGNASVPVVVMPPAWLPDP
ncbi:pentapeptide repeat-containing protein [Streptomyces sp. NPDC060333]|uniref:pentapeptide repeat-containing protein n=1 Tax=Streptomyces sp. NPDC060333 TaxID=3347098 RepID=UPI0036615EC1